MPNDTARLLTRAAQSLEAAALLLEHRLPGFAVSRAYYAMFYVAEALLLAQGLAFSKHSAVIAAFGEHFAKSHRLDPLFHQYLLEAFDKRQLGDYSPEEEITPVDAQEQLRRAQVFLQAAQTYLVRT